MKKLTTREKISAGVCALGMLGMIACADSLTQGFTTFASTEGVCLTVALIGVLIGKTAETEAPAANTMKGGESRHS